MSSAPNGGKESEGTVAPINSNAPDQTETGDCLSGNVGNHTEANGKTNGPQPVAVNPIKVGRYLACIITGLVLGGAIANYSIYNVAPDPEHEISDVLKRFDLGHEPSIPAFYSSVVMLLSAGTAAFLAVYDRGAQMRRRKSWLLLACLLTILAIDENVMFHEMGTAAMNKLGLSGSLYFSWVIPGSIFAVLAATALLHLLVLLGWRTRLLFISSGIIFLSGAIGMELIASKIFSNAESEVAAISSLAHVFSQAVEESLEMLGMALFFCSLLDFINLQGIRLWISTGPLEREGSLE